MTGLKQLHPGSGEYLEIKNREIRPGSQHTKVIMSICTVCLRDDLVEDDDFQFFTKIIFFSPNDTQSSGFVIKKNIVDMLNSHMK